MKFEILHINYYLYAVSGWYFLPGHGWLFFTQHDLVNYTHGRLRNAGYTYCYLGTAKPDCDPASPDETVSKRNFDELKFAHDKALLRLTNQERDHQALVKKLKERIQELELNPIPPIQWDQQKNFFIKETKTVEGYVPILKYEQMVSIASRNSDSASQYCRERDLARKTLDEVRALLNGQKLTP